jgi:2-C-methyl-D-erythritol 4-phosphate cytidylyltransferase/2-C-methyl-D-erythritol 2,4-cyclodiphosphate synthase
MRTGEGTAALIVAAGRGVRAGGGLPKQYRVVGGEPVLRRTVRAFLAAPGIDLVAVVVHPDDSALAAMALDGLASPRLAPFVMGAASRQASVGAGLEALAGARVARVLVHDGVRPFATAALIARVAAALASHDGAIAALPVVDTLKRGADGAIAGTIDRAGLYAAQTPQGFRFETLLAAHRAARQTGRDDFTDDASLLEWRGVPVALVPGEPDNMKLTTPDDFARAERLLAAARPLVRVGVGYDVHAFTDGDHVTLGGVRIGHGRGVLAHSDGDVALHAATDAVLGALGDGDIGTHFPPSDMRWKGASSDRFLAHAAALTRGRGGAIAHLDITIVCEAPRVGPHREAMRTAIAAAAGIAAEAVSIKATTSEKLGFTGRREGLAAMAVATVELPRG